MQDNLSNKIINDNISSSDENGCFQSKDIMDSSQQKLVEDNIGLAYSRCNAFLTCYKDYNISLDKDDFLSYAFEGLCLAAMKFDRSRNIKFSTFAYSYIDNYIKSNVYYENSTIKLPSYCADKDKMAYYRSAALNNSLVTSTFTIKDNPYGYTSEEENILSKIGTNDDLYNKFEQNDFIDFLKSKLIDKDKDIFHLLFVENATIVKTAELLNIHKNTVTRRKQYIVNKLQHFI